MTLLSTLSCWRALTIFSPILKYSLPFKIYSLHNVLIFTPSLTLPVLWSNQTSAWFLDSTLQSKVALFWAGRQRATDLPILTGSSRYTCRSWNGCELGRQANTANAEGIDFGLRVLLQPDTRDRFSWSRVAGLCCNPQRIIYNICGLRVGWTVSPLGF